MRLLFFSKFRKMNSSRRKIVFPLIDEFLLLIEKQYSTGRNPQHISNRQNPTAVLTPPQSPIAMPIPRQKKFLVCIVEDDSMYRQLMFRKLSSNPEFTVRTFEKAEDLLDEGELNPSVLFIDILLPEISGAQLLQLIRKKNKEVPVAITSGQSDIGLAMELLRNGADEYIVKDKNSLNNAWNFAMKIFSEKEAGSGVAGKTSASSGSPLIIGESESIVRLRGMIEKASRTSITVSITGETGTGKELVAKSVHQASGRSEKPFVAVNVAAIPRELIESELFGHEKGAFTGALNRRLGKFEEANGGTLFLDEITELDVTLQSKLLRVLQEKEVVRVGSNKPVPIDVRIVIATNKPLLAEVRKGKFREDLYYRFLGFGIELPALRERMEDVALLSRHFADGFCRENNLRPKTISDAALQKLMRYHFPGNIRELKAIVELGAALSGEENSIQETDINLEANVDSFTAPAEEMSLEEYNRKIILYYLKKYNNKVMTVAEKLNIGKSTIYNLIRTARESGLNGVS